MTDRIAAENNVEGVLLPERRVNLNQISFFEIDQRSNRIVHPEVLAFLMEVFC
jgi:hypothetical protein